ncbi:Phenylalanine ammonia lyase [Rhodotorula toruloides ATCC 204091]|uniref:Phenylalanine ammonia lyase n=1 Tax=Rhodotorula toruloides TaxID=5286 RepID=A0A0K3CQ71_RHOTO|nr:Phenylalanine ammonia lyase [Rhodotorula toruloides ATCC 204091]KAK4330592.1 Phenylalanine ammonia lyase [Rhodotorula toruloides]PRQ70857.1 phenylalanine ammonia lyase [Rhodotorula toruloides]
MGLPYLPAEILRLILDCALVPTTDRNAISHRYTLLLSFCHLSRQWRRVAQPLLFREMCMREADLEAAGRACRDLPRLAKRVRAFKVYGVGSPYREMSATRVPVLSGLRKIEELHLSFGGTVDLALLANLPRLRSFSAFRTTLTASTDYLRPFRKLAHLSLRQCTLDEAAISLIITRRMPSLVTLAYNGSTPALNFQNFPPTLHLVSTIDFRPLVEYARWVPLCENSLEISQAVSHADENGKRCIQDVLLPYGGAALLLEQTATSEAFAHLKTIYVAPPLSRSTNGRVERELAKQAEERGVRIVELGWLREWSKDAVVPACFLQELE